MGKATPKMLPAVSTGPPTPGRAVPVLLALVLVALAMAACGEGESPSSQLAGLTPPDAPLYVEGAVRPSDDQREAIESLTSSVAGISDPGELLEAEVETVLGGSDLTFTKDIEPWLGHRAALFVRSFETSRALGGMPDVAAAVEVADADAATEFIDDLAEGGLFSGPSRSYEGHTYLSESDTGGSVIGLVGDALVVGTEGSLKAAVDASSGESLADSEAFDTGIGALPGDPLLTAYVDLDTALDATVEAGGTSAASAAAARGLMSPLFEEPIAAGLEVLPDGVDLDVALATGEGLATRATPLLESVPGDAWFAWGFSDAGETAKGAVAKLEAASAETGRGDLRPGSVAREVRAVTGLNLSRDVLSLVGDAAVFIRGVGERDLEFGADLEVTASGSAMRTLGSARTAIGELPGTVVGPPLGDVEAGFSATGSSGSGAINVAHGEDLIRVALASSPRPIESEAMAGTLSDDETFHAAIDALSEEFSPLGFIDLDGLIEAASGALSQDGELLDPVARQLLSRLAFAAVGAHSTGEGDGFVVRGALRLDQ
jgi:Protein of unknown function (DUF3352)